MRRNPSATAEKKRTEKTEKTEKRKNVRRRILPTPPKIALVAAVPIALLVYYLTVVAPSEIPVPPGVKVPYPAATHFLEGVVAWCGEHAREVILIGVGLLLGGILFPLSSRRYYVKLAIFTTLALGFTYLSISAPIDRLIKKVEDELPPDRRFPDYLPPAPEDGHGH